MSVERILLVTCGVWLVVDGIRKWIQQKGFRHNAKASKEQPK